MRRLTKKINPISRQGLFYSFLLVFLILCLGGVGFWMIDPKVHSFSDGLWLAFTTAATVGYGDIVPHTDASRMFAVVVVLMGLGVLSLVTASVAALFVQTEERKIERELLDAMHEVQQQIRHLEQAVARLESSNYADGVPSTTSAAVRNASTEVGTPQ